MRIVMMPDDFGESIYKLLPYALTMCEQVAIWRPSLKQIDNLSKRDEIPYDVDDFLRFVEENIVVSVGRADWYQGPSGRAANKDWADQCPWYQGKDETLRKFSMQDEGLPLPARRVIKAPRPQGPEWAEELVDKNPDALKLAAKYLKNNAVPEGYIRRAESLSGINRGLSVLSNARNASLAIGEASAHMTIEPSQFAKNIAALGNRPSFEAASGELPSNESFYELLQILKNAFPFESSEKFSRFLKSSDRKLVLNWMQKLLMVEGIHGQLLADLYSERFSPSIKNWPDWKPSRYGLITSLAAIPFELYAIIFQNVAPNYLNLTIGISGLFEGPLREVGLLHYQENKVKDVKMLAALNSQRKGVNRFTLKAMQDSIASIKTEDLKLP
jgi:hypothetical protein